MERYKHGLRRLQSYSNTSSRWFPKATTGEANSFDVKDINLDASTTTDELISDINELNNVNGIQLTWPLRDHIDTARVYSAIGVSKDVDGILYVGQLEIGNKDVYPSILIIGMSPIVGSPIDDMVRQKGAVVQEEALEKLLGDAEVIITWAGLPGLVKVELM